MKKQKKGISLIVLIIVIIVMIILSSAVMISLSNSGIIGSARNAVSKMDKTQITQMAELLKGEYLADVASKKTSKSRQGLKEKLIEGFEVTKDTNGDYIIEVNDKWAVVIKNSELDIEVVEITAALRASAIAKLTYTTSNIVEEDVIYVTDVNISIAKLIEQQAYVDIMTEDAVKRASNSEKERAFYALFNEYSEYTRTFTNIDDIVVYIINNDYYSTEYTTIEECLADENVQAEWGTTKEQLYYYLYVNYIDNIDKETNSMTKQEVIDENYKLDQEFIYINKYSESIKNLKLYVIRPGKSEELLKDKIAISDDIVITDQIIKNGTYEYILKTKDDEEITSEQIIIDNIATEGKYILTEKEVDGVWTLDKYNNIKYTGKEENVVIPIRIGEKVITVIDYRAFYNAKIKTVEIPSSIKIIDNEAFNGSTIESIVIPETIKNIGVYHTFGNCKQLKEVTLKNDRIESWMFVGCTALETITIPANVTSIGQEAFAGCTNLKSIIFEGSITSYGIGVFRDCIGLKNVVIAEGDTDLRWSALFDGCTNLEEVTLPNSLIYMNGGSDHVFTGCTNLTKIYFAPGDNPIPEGEPWGAPNPDVQVIKLK